MTYRPIPLRRRPLSKKGSAWRRTTLGSHNRMTVVEPHDLWRDERAGPLSDVNRFPVATHNMVWEDLFDPDDDLPLAVHSSDPIGDLLDDVDELLGDAIPKAPRTAAKPRPRKKATKKGSGASTLAPIFDPRHNVREVCKQLVLLEDHLFQPNKRCDDCIRKHLLAAEAFAEEAVTLDKNQEHTDLTDGLVGKLRGIAKMASEGAGRESVAQAVRKLRKSLSKSCFGALGSAAVAEAGSAAVAMLQPSLKPMKIKGGEEVFVYYSDDVRFNVLAGVVSQVGSDCDGWEVRRIPDEGKVPVSHPDGDCVWPEAERLFRRPISGAPFLSEETKGRKLVTYWADGPRHPTMDDPRQVMGDLIQCVLINRLPDNLCRLAGVTSAGCRDKVVSKIVRAAMVVALYVSDLNPNAEGDGIGLFGLGERGAGIGLSTEQLKNPILNTERAALDLLWHIHGGQPPWELRAEGQGAGEVYEPSAKLRELVAREANAKSPAMAPSVGDWVAAWTTEVERPNNAEAVAERRRKTADALWSPSVVPKAAPMSQSTVARPTAATPPAAGQPRTVQGRGGYVYQQNPDGSIVILQSPPGGARKGLVVRSGPAWEAITAEIGPVPAAASTAATTTPAPGQVPVEARVPRQVATGSFESHGTDKKAQRAFEKKWRDNALVMGQLQRALLAEQRADGLKRSTGESPRYKEAAKEAGDVYVELGRSSGDVWPLARAAALFSAAGAVAATYHVRQMLLERHPGSEWASVARDEMVRLERAYPRAYLSTEGESRSLRPLIVGTATAVGVLGMLAALVGAARSSA